MVKSGYKTCKKCGLRHSTLVRHKCADIDAPERAVINEDAAPTDGSGKGVGGGAESDATDGQPDGGQQPDGQGDGDGEGEGEGEGEPKPGEGDGDGDGEGQGEGQSEQEGEDAPDEDEGPEPQPPAPETPIAVVVCTVLKYAALTAGCAKNGIIAVELAEEGLYVCGHNGDETAYATIPWGEFEKRSTIDGEYYVKEIIDDVDQRLDPNFDPAKAKPKAKAKAKPKLTLPLKVGQYVQCENGTLMQMVHELDNRHIHAVQLTACDIADDGHGMGWDGHHEVGSIWSYIAATGKFARSDFSTSMVLDLVADAEAPKKS